MSLLCGDLFDVLPTLDAESIDACVTDPPYGLGFMGKEWDTFSPAVAAKKQGLRQINRSESWTRKEKRVINPNLKGRTVDGAISSSQIEYDRSLSGQRAFQAWTERWAREVFRVLKPGAHLVVCAAPRCGHRVGCGIEDAGFEIRDTLCWLTGQGFPKSKNMGNGWGTALKPGYEPIILARKQFTGTVAANVAKHGTGAINVDGCRIEASDADVAVRANRNGDTGREVASGYHGGWHADGAPRSGVDLGRWPANVVLDDEAASLLDAQTVDLHGAGVARDKLVTTDYIASSYNMSGTVNMRRLGDDGGASRFYYVAKPSREERDLGCEQIDPRQRDETRKDGNPGGDNPRNRGLQRRGNYHPTVKPLALMRWLVRLVTPPGGTVCDPFLGSGTTGMACRLEQVSFIGIEREAEYVSIAERRIGSIAPLFAEGY